MQIIKLFTDGGARGNPGPAAVGVCGYGEDQKLLFDFGECIGEATNNIAEYKAVIAGLKAVKEKFQEVEVEANLDSELVVKQLNGEYKVKDKNLKELFYEVGDLVSDLGGRVSFCHIRREQNKYADELVNRALDCAK